jgi:excisionase family DNA binding protein
MGAAMSAIDNKIQPVSRPGWSDTGPLLTAGEVAAIVKVTTRTVWRWAEDGRIERVRIGRGVSRFTAASVARLIEPENEKRLGERRAVLTTSPGARPNMPNRSDPSRRDPLAERVLLDRSQRLARLAVANWPSTVERRLAVGQELYGDSWVDRSTADLLDEASEEAVDLAAWACLAVQSLSDDLDADTIATAGDMIGRAVGAAAEAHSYIVAARSALRKASR